MIIESKENRLVREMRSLLTSGKARRRSAYIAIEGARLCEDAVLSGVKPHALLATREAAQRYAGRFDTVAQAAETIAFIPNSLAKDLSGTDSPQGIFCLCPRPAFSPLDIDPGGVYLALQTMQDPGNLGCVIRTAEALGANGLLLSEDSCDPCSPKALRASMGGVFRLPTEICGDLVSRVRESSSRIPTLACVGSGDAVSVTALPKGGAMAVIGNEGSGLTYEMLSACAKRVTIPMRGRAESLNASMAAGIVLWELTKAR